MKLYIILLLSLFVTGCTTSDSENSVYFHSDEYNVAFPSKGGSKVVRITVDEDINSPDTPDWVEAYLFNQQGNSFEVEIIATLNISNKERKGKIAFSLTKNNEELFHIMITQE